MLQTAGLEINRYCMILLYWYTDISWSSSYSELYHSQDELEGAENDDADDMPEVQETVSVVPGSTLLWRIDSRPAHSSVVSKIKLHIHIGGPECTHANTLILDIFYSFSVSQMYNFTNFAMCLNELEPGMEAILPHTDCRFRPDIRAMENSNMGN